MIGNKFNFEDTFFRDLTVCVLDTLENQIRWVNRFSSGDYEVNVPFYYSLTGDERFLLDSFQDDIVSENRFIELNTDIIPRGHLTLKDISVKSEEFKNPNVWLRMVVENDEEIKKVLSKIRAIPITVSYSLEILLSTEIDIFKCTQALLDTMWLYKYMYFEYNFMHIDAIMVLPDQNSIEINREKNLTSDNNIKMSINFNVETFYPAFRLDRVSNDGVQYPGEGMTDMNGHTIYGGFSEYFNKPHDYINKMRQNPPDIEVPTNEPPEAGYPNSVDENGFVKVEGYMDGEKDYYIYSPKRTKWFNNILRTKSNPINNINNDDDGKLSK